MRTKLVPLVLLVAFAALALVVSTATAGPGPRRPPPPTTPRAAKPAPAVAKAPAMLPGSAYPWVQPIWRIVHGVVVVTLPRTIESPNTQPPAWVFSR